MFHEWNIDHSQLIDFFVTTLGPRLVMLKDRSDRQSSPYGLSSSYGVIFLNVTK